MEESLSSGYDRPYSPLNQYSGLDLAYLGDSVYELMIREYLLRQGNRPVNDLNRMGSELARAGAQSRMMEAIEPMLTPEEEAVYRRGRNSKPGTIAKHASLHDYLRATGFEALLGYLHIAGRDDRAAELVRSGWTYLRKDEARFL